MICCGGVCGSKQDHVLSNTFFQLLENMTFWKISAWEKIFADDVITLREEELKYCTRIVQVTVGSITICFLSAAIVVSNFCG